MSTDKATAKTAPLYERIQGRDPERMGGTQTRYASFDDFVTTFETEAKDPHVVGAADVLDIINPLQHLPLISNLYRELTGDAIKPGARIMGGAVFGGGMGLASSSVNAVVEDKTGHDVAANMALALNGEQSFVARSSDTPLEDPVKLAMGLSPASTPKDNPENTVKITWNDTPERVYTRSPQHVASAYARVARHSPESTPKPYETVVMTDPERMAGTLVRYA